MYRVGRAIVVAGALLSGVALCAGAEPDPLAAELDLRLTRDIAPILGTYCLRCHSDAKPKGDVRLDELRSLSGTLAWSGDLAKVREMVSTGQMPPDHKPQPSEHQRLLITQWIDAARAYVAPDAAIDPGWFTIHRLNREEYRNSIRDLLGIDPAGVDVAAGLPPDDTGYGFDNIADVLSTSPLSVEAYLAAAERAVETALGPEVVCGDVPRTLSLGHDGKSGHPTGRGGVGLYTNGVVTGRADLPAAGEYLLRVRAWETHAGDANARLSLRVDGAEVAEFWVSGTQGEPQIVEFRANLEAGPHTIGAAFTNDYWKPDVADRNLTVEMVSVAGPLDEATTRRSAAWDGVFDAGRGLRGDARAAAVLGAFAGRAYRRPLVAGEDQPLRALYRRGVEGGQSEEGAIRQGLTAVLVSPRFLFRALRNPRPDDPAQVYRLDGYELASRLSYFLWSSMPDAELLRAAGAGELAGEEGLRLQAARMLADDRASAFVKSFSGQWLQLRALDRLAIDTTVFTDYDAALRADMAREATLLVDEVVRRDRSVLDLLASDYTYVNARLARLYGLPGVEGPEFRRIGLPEGSARGGVLTTGAVLTLTSNPTRTSPVKRGLFVLDQVLGMAPPPPPADVPPLEKEGHALSGATLREQLAAHVASPTCASCHVRMDPLGLSLENFDAIGRWRELDAGKPIDASGVLPGGEQIDGPRGLKRTLLLRSDQFVETLSGKVLTYALGRGMEPFDRPAVRRIAERTRAAGDRFGALIEAVVTSETFRTCRGRESKP